MSRKIFALISLAALGAAGAAQAQVAWTQTPSAADVVAAYPARAKASRVTGSATLSCTLDRGMTPRQCAVLDESPGGYGFGAAAKQLVQGMRAARTETVHARSEVQVPVAFTAEALTGAGLVVRNPSWAAIPAASDFQATFPQTANGVNNVRVALLCSADEAGALSGCTVDREEPSGMGYGQAALALAPKFRVGAWSVDGLPTYGAKVRVPIRYELKPVAQASR